MTLRGGVVRITLANSYGVAGIDHSRLKMSFLRDRPRQRLITILVSVIGSCVLAWNGQLFAFTYKCTY
ncbi:MAG: hypothetical protein OXF08_04240 [Bacteroidetes bacterium]|nr:hypothetical protein [Bacteroidota bacterium]